LLNCIFNFRFAKVTSFSIDFAKLTPNFTPSKQKYVLQKSSKTEVCITRQELSIIKRLKLLSLWC